MAGRRREKTYYQVLRVEANASPAQIKRAYRRRALKVHPDKYPGNPAEANRLFKELVEAYHVLSDPIRRWLYDRQLSGRKGGPFGVERSWGRVNPGQRHWQELRSDRWTSATTALLLGALALVGGSLLLPALALGPLALLFARRAHRRVELGLAPPGTLEEAHAGLAFGAAGMLLGILVWGYVLLATTGVVPRGSPGVLPPEASEPPRRPAPPETPSEGAPPSGPHGRSEANPQLTARARAR